MTKPKHDLPGISN